MLKALPGKPPNDDAGVCPNGDCPMTTDCPNGETGAVDCPKTGDATPKGVDCCPIKPAPGFRVEAPKLLNDAADPVF